MFTVYCYDKCSTCRDALKWLDAHGAVYQVKASADPLFIIVAGHSSA